MKHWTLLVALGLAGCGNLPTCPEPNVSRYHNPAFSWRRVARLVVMPLVNESPQPQAGEEVRRSLHAELQQLGLFEAVPAPSELGESVSRHVRDGGRFSEAEMVALARCGAADVILVGTLTHYSPYQRPRIGLTLQAISPDLGKVVASVDGLWDATDHDVAQRARDYYRRVRSCKDYAFDYLLGRWESSYGTDLVLESPHLFQRFVCSEAARILVGLPPGRPIDEPAPLWAPGTILLTVKACLQSCWPKKEPCPPGQPPADPKKPAAENKPADKKDKGAEKKDKSAEKKGNGPEKPPDLPPPTPAEATPEGGRQGPEGAGPRR